MMTDEQSHQLYDVPEETQDLNFIDVFMPKITMSIDLMIIAGIEQTKNAGYNWNTRYADLFKLVSTDETKFERLKKDATVVQQKEADEFKIAQNIQNRGIVKMLVQFDRKLSEGHIPTPEEFLLMSEFRQKLSVENAPVSSQSNEEINPSIDKELPETESNDNEDSKPQFFTENHEADIQTVQQSTAETYFNQRHKPKFHAQLWQIKKTIEHTRKQIKGKARPSSFLALLERSNYLKACLMGVIAFFFEFVVYYNFGHIVLEWSIGESASLAIVPVLVSKFAGPLLFKADLYTAMKTGKPFMTKGRTWIIGLCLALALGVGFSVYSSKKMADDRIELLSKALMNMSADMTTTEEDVLNSDVAIIDSPILETLHKGAIFLSVALLGIMAFLIGGFFFTRLEIIAPIVELKKQLKRSEEHYAKVVARTASLIEGRKEGLRLAGEIAGRRALLKAKTREHNNKNLFT